eukprot:187494-Prymnesium_polylepis.1
MLVAPHSTVPLGEQAETVVQPTRVVVLLSDTGSSAPSVHSTVIVLALIEKLAPCSPPLNVHTITHGALTCRAANGGAWGLGRVLRLEYPALHAQMSDLRPGADVRALQGDSAESE